MVIGVGLLEETGEGDAEWAYVVSTPDGSVHERRTREIFSTVLDSPFGVRVAVAFGDGLPAAATGAAKHLANLLMVASVDERDLSLWRRRLGGRVVLAAATTGAAVIASKRRTLRSSDGLVAAEFGRRDLGLSRAGR